MKYDSTGSVQWTSLQGSIGSAVDDYAYGVAVSADGFIYVTGKTFGSINGQPNKGR